MAPLATRPELQMLFACARLSPALEQVRALASQELDWSQLAQAAEFHGLTPLLLRGLRTAGVSPASNTAKEMEQWNAATVRLNLYLTSELLRIHAAFKESGIETIPLKGPALASQIYGDLGLRPFSDIDLLVRREQINEAESAVKEIGYEAEFAIPQQHRERWLRQQCELTFRRSGTIRLELHWDIAHPHFALETGVEEFWSRLGTVQVGDAVLPNLSQQDLLFLLIVHGTRHAWSRMMWLVDVAELLRQGPAIDWESFWQNAKERGAARMMATGLALVREAFGVPLPPADQAPKHDAAIGLADQVIARWNESLGTRELPEAESAPLWRHRWIVRSRENRTQRWAYMGRVMTMIGEEEFGVVTLPGILSPFYNLIRWWNMARKARPGAKAVSMRAKG